MDKATILNDFDRVIRRLDASLKRRNGMANNVASAVADLETIKEAVRVNLGQIAVRNWWKGKKMSAEHRRAIGYAKKRWWAFLPEERKQEIRRKQDEGRARRYSSKPRKGKGRLIGRLGDIEEYELSIGYRRKSPAGLHSDWSRGRAGRPELKRVKRCALDRKERCLKGALRGWSIGPANDIVLAGLLGSLVLKRKWTA